MAGSEVGGVLGPDGTLHMRPMEGAGVLVPEKEFFAYMNHAIIEHRKKHGQNDPFGFRNEGELEFLCYRTKNHRYRKDRPLDNALYVSTEVLYSLACRHAFMEANKSTAFAAAMALLATNLQFYVNLQSERKYELLLLKVTESEHKGRIIEKVASWAAEGRAEALESLLRERKLLRAGSAPNEQVVKTFIRQFLQEFIVEVEKRG